MKPRDYRAALAAHVERTPWAQRKAGRGIRIERLNRRMFIVRTVLAPHGEIEGLPVTVMQLRRFS